MFIPIECGLHWIPYLMPYCKALENLTIHFQHLRTLLSTANEEMRPIWNRERSPQGPDKLGHLLCWFLDLLRASWPDLLQRVRCSISDLAGQLSAGYAAAKPSFFGHCCSWAGRRGRASLRWSLSSAQSVEYEPYSKRAPTKSMTAPSVWKGRLKAVRNITCPERTFGWGMLARVKTPSSCLSLYQSFQNWEAGTKDVIGLSWGDRHKEERLAGYLWWGRAHEELTLNFTSKSVWILKKFSKKYLGNLHTFSLSLLQHQEASSWQGPRSCYVTKGQGWTKHPAAPGPVHFIPGFLLASPGNLQMQNRCLLPGLF